MDGVAAGGEVGEHGGVLAAARKTEGARGGEGIAERGGGGGAGTDGRAPIVVGCEGCLPRGVRECERGVGKRTREAERRKRRARGAHEQTARAGAGRDHEARDRDARAGADVGPRGEIHERGSAPADIVDFDEGEARALAVETRNLCSVGARGQGDGDGRVLAAGGQRERADRRHGRGIGGEPVVVGGEGGAGGVDECKYGIAEHAGEPIARQRGADGADEHGLAGTGSDDKAGREDIGAGAGLGARGEVDETRSLGGRERDGAEGENGRI